MGSLDSSSAPRAAWAAVAVLTLVTLACYANALSGRFLSDDLYLIVDNPALRSWENLPGLFTTGFWSTAGQEAHAANYYRPVVAVLALVQYQAFGNDPLGYHVFNVALHLVVTLGVFGIARRLLPGNGPTAIAGPLVAGLLFAAHPVHTENVAWISGITDLACAVFLVLAWQADLRSTRVIHAVATGFLLFLALLCKEVAIVFPAILVVQDRVRGAQRGRAGWTRYAIVGGFVLAYLALRTFSLRGIAPVDKNALQLTVGEGILNAFVVFARYLALLVRPADLCFVHVVEPHRSWLSWTVALSVATTVAVAALTVRALILRRPAAVALAALTLPLLPVVYLPFIGPMFAERFLYVPSIGAALLAGLLFDRVRERLAVPRRRIATAAVAVVVAILGASTVDRNADWHDELTHSLDVTRKVPTASSQHLVVAYAMYFRLNRPEEGLRHYEAAFRVRPELRKRVVPGLNEFGVGFLRARDFPAAIRHFDLAVRFDPGYALAYNNLGIAYFEQGQVGLAIEHFRKALAADPENRQARANLERLSNR